MCGGTTEAFSTPLRAPSRAAAHLDTRRRWRVLVAALAVIAAAASVMVLLNRHSMNARSNPGSPPTPAALGSTTPKAGRSLAVLPFQRLGPVIGEDVQGLGMADSLITRLGLLQDLAVRPLASVRLYANGDKDPQAAGRELHVDSVLDGSLQADADRVRVRVRLYRVSDGTLLWAGQFDQSSRDLFALQDSLSEKVATALSRQLTARPRPAVPRDAYENYVRGRYFFEQFTSEGNSKAVEYFENAIRIQPDFAAAYAGLALNYCPMIMRGFVSVGEGTPKLRQAVERALALDDSLPEAHTALATLRWLEFDWAGAERAVKRALELNPSYLHAYGWYTTLLDMLGRGEEALALRQRELELDPVSDYAAKDFGTGLLLVGRYAEAVEQMRKTLELRPGFEPAQEGLAVAYIGLHRFDDAHRAFTDAGELFGAAYVRVLQGDPVPARVLIDRFADIDFRTRTALAALHTVLGEKEQAVLLLERALDERDAGVLFLKVNPAFDSLRSAPRFKTLIARLHM
jgi:TolB-like protein